MTVFRTLGRVLLVALVGGLLAQALIVYAPGYSADERELDPALTTGTRAELLKAKSEDRQLLATYWRFLNGVAHGDFGISRSLGRPVRELLNDRVPVTATTILEAVALGWMLGFPLAIVSSLKPGSLLETAGSTATNLLLCVPAAVVALFLLIWADARTSGAVWVVALTLTPKVFRYSFNLLRQCQESPHILLARAKGLGPVRILFRHVIPPVVGPLIALAGITVSLGLSAAIPAEVILDVPGIGQLAWQAALSRDLPLLVSLTFVVALVGTVANSLSDHLIDRDMAAL